MSGMSKPFKSQWDFGELFPPESGRRVLTVGELTVSVKRLLEREIGSVWVTGEVSNLRLQSSGHVYFCLKDASAQVSCVLFRNEARSVNRELLADGKKLVVRAEMTVYEARGQYQLRVTSVELQGQGALQAAFEKLKQKLNAEGLFAPERKRPLPRYAERIGLVTSPSAAALQDVLNVMRRRHRGLELILASCRVQGQGAAEEIACAIRLLNEWSASNGPGRGLDLILVTRGGGSLEDLWAFNEEVVARAIFESTIPVVSAVGHEIDFTISDFVADVRAATPSVAAELITEGFFASRKFVSEASEHLRVMVEGRLELELEHLVGFSRRLRRAHPRRRLEERGQRLDDLRDDLIRLARQQIRANRAAWQAAAHRLARVRPALRLVESRARFAQLRERLFDAGHSSIRNRQVALEAMDSQLRLLSPENVLRRGYSITLDAATRRVIRSALEVKEGQTLVTKLKEGEVRSAAIESSGLVKE